MTTDVTGNQDLESLLESGKISESMSVTDMAALLAGQPLPSVDEEGNVVSDGAKPGIEAAPLAVAAANEAAPDAVDAAAAVEEAETKTFGKQPLYGVLKNTRSDLRSTREMLAEEKRRSQTLEKERDDLLTKAQRGGQQGDAAVQQAADDAGILDDEGQTVDVKSVDVAGLRGNFDDQIVDAIETLQNALIQSQQTVQELRNREVTRNVREVAAKEDDLQSAIDSVPVVAEWQSSEDPTKWVAAQAVDSLLRKDPVWQTKPLVERFQEVARRLGGEVASVAANPSPQQVDKTVLAAKQLAAARAAPISHSDLPSGLAASQSDTETLESLSAVQIAEKMGSMKPDQINALLERFG